MLIKTAHAPVTAQSGNVTATRGVQIGQYREASASGTVPRPAGNIIATRGATTLSNKEDCVSGTVQNGGLDFVHTIRKT